MWNRVIFLVCVTVVVTMASSGHAIVIGNWENGNWDGWTADETTVRFDDVNGVTLGTCSLGIHIPRNKQSPEWDQDFLKIDLIANELFDIFRANQRMSVDVTWLLADWLEDQIPGWNGLHFTVNIGGDGWSAWTTSPQLQNWTRRWNPQDETQKATWSYGQHFGEWHSLQDVTWCELMIVSNCNDTNYNGPVTFYLDNFELCGAGAALAPDPGINAVDVPVDAMLSWVPGSYAQVHHVYFGTDERAVTNAQSNSDPNVVFVETDTPTFDPGALQFNTRYVWRVDEVNDDHGNSPWMGTVWSFTTANFLVVDNFETYTNDSPNRLFQAWRDGLGFSPDEFFPNGYDGNGTGSTVGNDPSFGNIMETTNVHGGTQAMPMDYDNRDAKISEAVRTWAAPQDWTVNNFQVLKLYINGQADNGLDTLYIEVKDSGGYSATVTHEDPAILAATEWTEWQIPLSALAGVNVAAITEMTIGVGSLGNPKAVTGRLLIDDIIVAPMPLGLVAHYTMENNVEDSSGNGFHGTVEGDPNMPLAYVDGPAGFGTGILFYGEVGHERVELGMFNPSDATGQLSVALWAKWNGLSDHWQGLIGKKFSAWSRNAMMWQIEIHQSSGALRVQREGSNDIQIDEDGMTVGEWTHLAFTFDGVTGRTYLNGTPANEAEFSFGYALDAPVHIGCTSTGGGNPFNGAIDEVSFYDRALSEAEVAQLAGK